MVVVNEVVEVIAVNVLAVVLNGASVLTLNVATSISVDVSAKTPL
jgi:hypothetical protein